MKNLRKKLMTVLLTAVMAVGILQVSAVTVFAEENPLKFTANAASEITFNYSSGTDVQYRKNDGAWTDCPSGTLIELTAGEYVSFKGTGVTTNNGDKHFTITGYVTASGDITSLTNGAGGVEELETERCYQYMFLGCSGLTDAGDLILPSTTLSKYCYQYMFKGCVNLTKAPELCSSTRK